MTTILKHFSIALFLLTIGCKTQQKEPVAEPKKEETMQEIAAQLEKMSDAEQEIRRILVDSIGFTSPEAAPYKKEMKRIDSINQRYLVKVLDTHGWIHRDSIGKKAARAMFLIIQHSEPETLGKYFPMFKAMADKGGASKTQACLMEDRLLMWNGKKQIYGTQASSNVRSDDMGKVVIWPIENPEEVNELRKAIGFSSTVEEYAERLGAIYDPNERLPEQ